jgi:two-component system LytT family response regulator
VPVPAAVPRKTPAPPPPGAWLEGFCPEPHAEAHFAVSSNGQILFVSVADVEWVDTADTHVKLHVGRHTYRLQETFAVVGAKLPTGRFVRISRSTLVNVQQIQGVQRLLFDEYEVVLRSGRRLPLARGYASHLL